MAWGHQGRLIVVYPACEMVLVTTAHGLTDAAAWPLRDLIANMPGAVVGGSLETCPKDAGEACTKDYHCKSGTGLRVLRAPALAALR